MSDYVISHKSFFMKGEVGRSFKFRGKGFDRYRESARVRGSSPLSKAER